MRPVRRRLIRATLQQHGFWMAVSLPGRIHVRLASSSAASQGNALTEARIEVPTHVSSCRSKIIRNTTATNSPRTIRVIDIFLQGIDMMPLLTNLAAEEYTGCEQRFASDALHGYVYNAILWCTVLYKVRCAVPYAVMFPYVVEQPVPYTVSSAIPWCQRCMLGHFT